MRKKKEEKIKYKGYSFKLNTLTKKRLDEKYLKEKSWNILFKRLCDLDDKYKN